MRTHDQIERDLLLEQICRDVEVLRAKYRPPFVPTEAARAFDNLTRLCTLLVDAIRLLEEQHGRKTG